MDVKTLTNAELDVLLQEVNEEVAARRLEKRFWERVDVGNSDYGTCWLWRGRKTHTGYGYIRHKQKNLLAHRVAWELEEMRPVPKGKMVKRTCENILCVRPLHLEVIGDGEDAEWT